MPEVGTKRKRPNGANKPKKTVRFQNNKNNKSRKYNNAPAFVHGNFSNQTMYGPFVTGWQTQTETNAAYKSLENHHPLLRQGYSVNFRPVITELTKHSNSKVYEPSYRNTHNQITNNTILRNAQAVTNRVYKQSTPNQIARAQAQAQAQLKPLPVLFELGHK